MSELWDRYFDYGSFLLRILLIVYVSLIAPTLVNAIKELIVICLTKKKCSFLLLHYLIKNCYEMIIWDKCYASVYFNFLIVQWNTIKSFTPSE